MPPAKTPLSSAPPSGDAAAVLFAGAGNGSTDGGATHPAMNRRHFLTSAAGVSAAALPVNTATAAEDYYVAKKGGRIKQSVIHWCFNPMPVEELKPQPRPVIEEGIDTLNVIALNYNYWSGQ